MVQLYVTSITNDASGTLEARQAAYGSTYPFPPRYADRYMPATELDTYTTRSFMFGGQWVFMNRLLDLSPEDQNLAAREIVAFKRMRAGVRDGEVFHLTAAPAENHVDAIQSYNPATDRAVALVTRQDAEASDYRLLFRGLRPGGSYRVTFQDSTTELRMTGGQLMQDGVDVPLDQDLSAAIVWAEGLPDTPSTTGDAVRRPSAR